MLNLDTHILLHAVVGHTAGASETRLLNLSEALERVGDRALGDREAGAAWAGLRSISWDPEVVPVLPPVSQAWPITREIAHGQHPAWMSGAISAYELATAATSVVHNVPLPV